LVRAVAILMFAVSGGLPDTDDGHNDTDCCDRNIRNRDYVC
jgi:hypothetical protein